MMQAEERRLVSMHPNLVGPRVGQHALFGRTRSLWNQAGWNHIEIQRWMRGDLEEQSSGQLKSGAMETSSSFSSKSRLELGNELEPSSHVSLDALAFVYKSVAKGGIGLSISSWASQSNL